MDYEKKYKDALEKAKEVYNRKDATDGGKLILESMFPELKENEDEKMRAMAIKAVYSPEAQSCIKSWGINPDDVIAWLEKKGEQKSVSGNDRETEINLVKILKHYPRETELYSPLYGKLWLAEVDEKNEIITCYKHRLDEGCTRAILEQEDNVSFYSNGTTGLPDFSISKDCMLFLYDIEKKGVQKPIISNNALREGIAHFGITQYQIDNWLKKYVDVEKQAELQYWKPSKEQLEALDYAYNSCPDTERGNYYEGVLRALRVDELYKLQEKQGKPKPADKAQPKFKVGDWCIDNEDNTIFQITKVLSNLYYYRTNEGKEYSCTRDSIERDAHLWTIQDAKDGDVLVTYDIRGNIEWLFLYMPNKHKLYINDPRFYCHYDINSDSFKKDNDYISVALGTKFSPATKEQCDLLFTKMKEAGYEWDFEVKELNKIEKKSAWSEEEKQLLLKDLCARLPYKVRCKCVSGLGGGETEKGVLKYVGNCYGVISNYYEGVPLHSGFVNNVFYPIENIKPYLRPMLSMTDEEFQKLRSICPHSMINKTNVTEWFVGINGSDYGRISRVDEISEFIDWLNAHYFDFRGLIEKGLALEAPEGMYNGFQRHDL